MVAASQMESDVMLQDKYNDGAITGGCDDILNKALLCEIS